MADDSVHALLADEELVDCTLLIDGEGMGHLLGDDKAGDLAKGAQLKLALWLALVLAKKNMVRISLPNRYGASVRADLEAGPTVVDLHSIAPYYYTVGHKLADATGEDSLRKELRAAISGDRFEKAFDWSQVSLDRDVSELRETLAREEQEGGGHEHIVHGVLPEPLDDRALPLLPRPLRALLVLRDDRHPAVLVAFAKGTALEVAIQRQRTWHARGMRAMVELSPLQSKTEAEKMAEARGVFQLDWINP